MGLEGTDGGRHALILCRTCVSLGRGEGLLGSAGFSRRLVDHEGDAWDIPNLTILYPSRLEGWPDYGILLESGSVSASWWLLLSTDWWTDSPTLQGRVPLTAIQVSSGRLLARIILLPTTLLSMLSFVRQMMVVLLSVLLGAM